MPAVCILKRRLSWLWPQWRLRDGFVGLAAIAGLCAILRRAPYEEAVGALAGGIVLLWTVFCWALVRRNRW